MKRSIAHVCPLVILLTTGCLSCGPLTDLRDFADADLFPPVIENILPVDENSIMLCFNETVQICGDPLLNPSLGSPVISYEENSLLLRFTEKQRAGTRYVIDAEVSDEKGNRMSFLIPFYGFNPFLPELIINEFTTQGSSTHPDIIEILVTGSGNLAGLWVVEGTTDFPENSTILPDCDVEQGDYLLIHFKPQGIAEEINENSEELDVSGGLDASPTARDFWVEGGRGLSGNNGVIAVYSAPGGRIMDAVLYSNRTSASDEKYSGFGSRKMLDKALQIVDEGGWFGTGDGGAPIPEDGVNPDDSTATRSICRESEPSDTNTKSDWHIVPTSSYSFGGINTDAVYEP